MRNSILLATLSLLCFTSASFAQCGMAARPTITVSSCGASSSQYGQTQFRVGLFGRVYATNSCASSSSMNSNCSSATYSTASDCSAPAMAQAPVMPTVVSTSKETYQKVVYSLNGVYFERFELVPTSLPQPLPKP